MKKSILNSVYQLLNFLANLIFFVGMKLLSVSIVRLSLSYLQFEKKIMKIKTNIIHKFLHGYIQNYIRNCLKFFQNDISQYTIHVVVFDKSRQVIVYTIFVWQKRAVYKKKIIRNGVKYMFMKSEVLRAESVIS